MFVYQFETTWFLFINLILRRKSKRTKKKKNDPCGNKRGQM